MKLSLKEKSTSKRLYDRPKHSMREYEDAKMYVQVRYEGGHNESTTRIGKDVYFESRLLRNKIKYGVDMSRDKPNQ
jgi:hypothetical protein